MDTTLKKRFIQNHQNFWKTHCWIILIYLIALTADGISTIRFMLADGTETELHPVINLVSSLIGPVLGPIISIIGKAIAGVIVAIYWRRFAWIILSTTSVVSFWAAWYNTWGWQYYELGILRWWPL